MKKLIFVFILIFLFAGCSANDVTDSKDIPQSSVVENPGPNLGTLQEYADKITIEDILNADKLKSLETEGISASVKSCQVVSLTEAQTVIEFTKDDYTVSIDTVMDICYFGASSNPYYFQLGGFNVTIGESQLIITQRYGIKKYTLDKLEYIDEINVFKDTFRLVDTLPGKGMNYISLSADGERASIITFNEEGQVQGNTSVDRGIVHAVLKRKGYYNQPYAVAPQPQLIMLDDGAVLFTSANTITEDTAFVCYPLQYRPRVQTYLNDPKGEFYILDSATDREYTYVFVMKDSKIVNSMCTSDNYLLDGKWGESGVVKKQWDTDERITLVCNSTGKELTFDFENNKIWDELPPEYIVENNLQEKYSDSPDGKYSLWWADGGSGGDVMVMDMYLVENRTGKAKYLDTIGGMYGGNAGCGFFSNGDIYTIMLDEFKVFTTDMSQKGPVFEMSKNFPLGDNAVGQGTYRDLLSARRDPVTHSWTVLYNEFESQEMYRDYFVDYDKFSDNFYKSTYKVGILDPQGNLTKVYDTGEYVMSYSFRQIKMHMEAGDILYFSVLFKGYDPQLEGKIDLKTGEYTNISGGYNSL